MSPFTEAAMFLRYMRGMPAYLRRTLSSEDCRARLEADLKARLDNFRRVFDDAIFARPDGPYRRLLAHAGIEHKDVHHLIATAGIEGTLETLYDEGVRLGLDEFKGRVPVRRGSFSFEVASRDFDNPRSARHFASSTSGSRSPGTRYYVDLDHHAGDAVYDRHFLEAFGLIGRPYAVWRPTPPWNAGFKNVLSQAKLGLRTERWFAQHPYRLDRRSWKHVAVTGYAVHASRLLGRPLPRPEHVPLDQAWRVAAWLAEKKQQGTPAMLSTNVASAVRVCIAAIERGLDIAGSVIRVGGEPLTPARASTIARAGCRAIAHYTMGETGRIGIACAHADALDDVHLLTDKLALIQRVRPGRPGPQVAINTYTALSASAPKLMLNVESDDYSALVRRSCGCLFDRLGLDAHLHDIRSYEKLTSEGMTFLGNDLLRLVEEVLPARIGGHPTDYQFVEGEDADGLPRVELFVSPRVGPCDEAAVVDTVIEFLNHLPRASGAFGERWREGRTLRVVRREPQATGASKVLALHVTRPKQELGAAGARASDRAAAP